MLKKSFARKTQKYYTSTAMNFLKYPESRFFKLIFISVLSSAHGSAVEDTNGVKNTSVLKKIHLDKSHPLQNQLLHSLLSIE